MDWRLKEPHKHSTPGSELYFLKKYLTFLFFEHEEIHNPEMLPFSY
jgi:hypothetical protein